MVLPMSMSAPPSSERFCVEQQGCRLSGSVCGSGPPVLLIQGTGLHGDGWLPQVMGLHGRHECLWFDNRGMGASQPHGAAITVELMAQDALALMDARGWATAHVVGHSLGGLVALRLALTARERVRSLSLLCSFSRGRDATQMSWKMLWLALRTMVGTRRMRRRAFLEYVLPPSLLAGSDLDDWAERLAPVFGHDLADHPPVVMKQVAAMRACDVTPDLGKLAGVPTLVVSAAHDIIASPEVGRALAAGIPGTRLIEFPDAAHGVTIQNADQITELLAEHFSQAEGMLTALPPIHPRQSLQGTIVRP